MYRRRDLTFAPLLELAPLRQPLVMGCDSVVRGEAWGSLRKSLLLKESHFEDGLPPPTRRPQYVPDEPLGLYHGRVQIKEVFRPGELTDFGS